MKKLLKSEKMKKSLKDASLASLGLVLIQSPRKVYTESIQCFATWNTEAREKKRCVQSAV